MTTQQSVIANPNFFIEMSHHLRHIIMKRSYFLRSTRARTLFCREQIAGKSWLEVSLAEKPKAGVLPWDQAHNLAERFKAELKADVFVEPAHPVGRHHKLTAQETESSFASDTNRHEGLGSAFSIDPRAGVFSGTVRVSRPGFGSQFGMSGMGMNRPSLNSASGFTDIGRIPTDDFLPTHVREVQSSDHSSEMVLSALRLLPAFGKLPEATQNMYEVEVTQLLKIMIIQPGAIDHDIGLGALLQCPGTSKHLIRFLSEALPIAA